MAAPLRLELLIPGLLGPWPALPLGPDGAGAPPTPVLDLLLARGDPWPGAWTDLDTALLTRFAAAASAPYQLAAEGADWDRQGFWMHADPVHLRPDRDRLRLYDARHLGLSRAEADALVAELNAHFGADGLRLIAPDPRRWYLHTEHPPDLITCPLGQASGTDLDGRLPRGPDARRWNGLLNEMQMLLFQSPVNQARERAGRATVNGLWTWGGGRWQALAPPAALARLWSDRLLDQGLAAAAGIPVEPLPGSAAALLEDATAGGTDLVVMPDLASALEERDETAWLAALAAAERWLAPVLPALRAGRLAEVCLALGETPPPAALQDRGTPTGRCLRRGHLRRFWRRPHPVARRATLGG